MNVLVVFLFTLILKLFPTKMKKMVYAIFLFINKIITTQSEAGPVLRLLLIFSLDDLIKCVLIKKEFSPPYLERV